ncbi:MAG: ABC transporter ATP-binding protein [Oscillospiraceae bacterium]|nr:ABC transporter ATP-binding protein [Oscillospiraceae bacterium]
MNFRKGPPGQRMAMPVEKPKNMRRTLKRLISYIGRSRSIFFVLMATMTAITACSLISPSLQGFAIDAITITEGHLQIEFDKFLKMLTLLGVSYALTSVLTYSQVLLSAKLSQTTVYTMRNDLFSKMVRLPIKYTDTHQHGDIMSRMTNDVENISNTVSQSIGSLLSSGLTVTGTVIIMLIRSPILTLVSMTSIALTLIATNIMSKYMRKYFKRQQVILGRVNGHAEENITGYKTVAAFSKEDKACMEFRRLSDELRICGIKAATLGGCMGPIMNTIGNIGFLLIAAAGGALALRGAISVGTIQTFIIYAKQFSRPISEIANQFAQIQTAVAGAERVFEIMDENPEKDEGTAGNIDVKGAISFENITFSYKEGEPVLRDFNLEIKPGEKVALVGATGSGKTTVVNLLTRFYDTDGGSIKIDGVDINDIKKDELRKNIAIVLQDTVLFSDSIRSNILYGRLDAEESEVKRAAQVSNAHSFICRLPEGYDTVLTEGGGNLSQGERQLLSITRAVLADPKILILDEATSSVDTRTELHIQKAMIALMKNRTSIIIAHRLSTIQDADIIVVLDGGRIKEAGSHDELIEKRGSYYNLYKSQFAGNAT